MQRSLSLLLATVLLCAALSGCSGKVPLANLFNKAEFWQRTDIREAAYMGRDKAQDLLHRDIAKCVSDV
ncbi:MAG: hypothetical protein KJ667_09755, partial [Alphaproteobacteria bacterium]|nr:hypothetical protein [Alphaproteobacteria bacterium]